MGSVLVRVAEPGALWLVCRSRGTSALLCAHIDKTNLWGGLSD